MAKNQSSKGRAQEPADKAEQAGEGTASTVEASTQSTVDPPADPPADKAEQAGEGLSRRAVSAELVGMTQDEIRDMARDELGLELPASMSRFQQTDAIFRALVARRELDAVGPEPGSEIVWEVESREKSFRRGGLAFGRDPRPIDPSKLTEEQRKLIEHEPRLIVRKRRAGEE